MKKTVSLILSFALSFTLAAPVFAEGDTVAASDVERVLEQSSLANNAEDLAAFQAALKYDKELSGSASRPAQMLSDSVDCKKMYPVYLFDYDADTNKDYIQTADASSVKLSELITYKPPGYSDPTATYLFREKDDENMSGIVYISSTIGYGMSSLGMDEEHLMFNGDEMAQILNAEHLGVPNAIKYIEGALINYYDSVADHNMILLETDSGEYVITGVHYTDGELSHWFVVPAADFIRYVQGDKDALLKRAYESMDMLAAPVFSDVKDASVDLLARMGVISGYSDGTFKPDNNVTRAEAAKLIANLTKEEYEDLDVWIDDDMDTFPGPTIYDSFTITDIPDGYWAKKYIVFGLRNGYISGKEYAGKVTRHGNYIPDETDQNGAVSYKDDDYEIDAYKFCPEDSVTETEFAKLLVSSIESHGDIMAQAEGGYPEGYKSVAKRLGIIENASDAPASRLTAARMIKNALDAYVTGEIENVILPDNNREVFTSSDNVETIYNKGLYYDLDYSKNRVRLEGKITASHDTDPSVREKEFKFTLAKDAKYGANIMENKYAAGDEITILARYDDVITNHIGKDCTLYCMERDGLLIAIMAE